MKRALTYFVAAVALISCSKDEDNGGTTNPPGATSLGQLTIPLSFDWSNSIKGNTSVTLLADNDFESDGGELWVVDENDTRLLRKKVINGKCDLYINLPVSDGKYYFFYPLTGDKMEITRAGDISFQLHTDFDDLNSIVSNVAPSGKKSSASAKGKTAANLLVNGDFEVNNFSPAPSFSDPISNIAGQWYTTGSIDWKNGNGGKVLAPLSGNITASQAVAVTPGDSFTVSATTSGTNYYFVLWYANGSSTSYNGYKYFFTTSGSISGSGVVPSNINYARVYLWTVNGWIDDVSFDSGPSVPDADNDGVDDNNDDYPNDPTKAYASYFPSAGYQTLAFEDLWPAKGDYDFNDMVVSTQVEFSSDSNNDLVDATFTISLDAVGSGVSNGLALVLLNSNGQAFGQDIIASVSGNVSTDPNVTNGLIVFNDVFQAQSTYYTNNGSGPAATPDEFTFTVSFNANAGNQSILPDIYIYRTSERGREIHLDGFSGTAAANSALNNTIDDLNGTYNTGSGLPWAIEVITSNKSFQHPLEKNDILVAYPNFQVWAESSGSQNTDWKDNPVLNKVF